jgi:hypothetical protein
MRGGVGVVTVVVEGQRASNGCGVKDSNEEPDSEIICEQHKASPFCSKSIYSEQIQEFTSFLFYDLMWEYPFQITILNCQSEVAGQ